MYFLRLLLNEKLEVELFSILGSSFHAFAPVYIKSVCLFIRNFFDIKNHQLTYFLCCFIHFNRINRGESALWFRNRNSWLRSLVLASARGNDFVSKAVALFIVF